MYKKIVSVLTKPVSHELAQIRVTRVNNDFGSISTRFETSIMPKNPLFKLKVLGSLGKISIILSYITTDTSERQSASASVQLDATSMLGGLGVFRLIDVDRKVTEHSTETTNQALEELIIDSLKNQLLKGLDSRLNNQNDAEANESKALKTIVEAVRQINLYQIK